MAESDRIRASPHVATVGTASQRGVAGSNSVVRFTRTACKEGYSSLLQRCGSRLGEALRVLAANERLDGVFERKVEARAGGTIAQTITGDASHDDWAK